MGKVPEQGGRGKEERLYAGKGAGVDSEQCLVQGSVAGQYIKGAAVLELWRSAAAAAQR